MNAGVLKSGIYGLFRLDGAPVDLVEAAALGLPTSGEAGAAQAQGADPQAPNAVHRAEDAEALTILVGELEAQEALAAELGVQAQTPPAMLARRALQRFGSATPATMLGEWSLLHWERAGRLTLMQSAGRRDPLLYAHSGARVAVASDLFRLSRLPWIGTTVDEAGLLFALGRMDLRAGRDGRTMLARVRQVEPASSVTIDVSGAHGETADVFPLPPAWTGGSFDDALDEAELVMRRITRGRLSRAAVPAVLLSGGLDSSLLATLAAEERGGSQKVVLLTSVAPAGSGLPDEIEFAGMVAERLGLRTEPVLAPAEASIYRPSDAILGGANGPTLSNRHLLTDALQLAARQAGATLLVNGCFGEMTLSARATPASSRAWIRRSVGRLYRSLQRPREHLATALNPFHARLSADRSARLPEPIRAALAAPPPAVLPRAGDRWGYLPGVEKALRQTNEVFPGALRMDYPYRDLRLLRLFAALPADIAPPRARDRAFARAMLAGRLPDTIRLRTSGRPAEPDHDLRLQRQAPAARARIAVFRKAELHEWLDLDWLDGALARMAEHGVTDRRQATEVEVTALAAEFLMWWRGRS